MSKLIKSILAVAHTKPEGGLLSAKEFLHLGSRAAVDKTLSRLAQDGKLIRVCRGAYAKPCAGLFGSRPPSVEAIAQALETEKGETVVASGAAEANELGLTTQVPVREVFFTNGSNRVLQLGKRNVEFRRCPRWLTQLGKSPAGKVIRALAWLGPENAPQAAKQLYLKISQTEWQAVLNHRSSMPGWMAKTISEVEANG